jgi:hypothetical protein
MTDAATLRFAAGLGSVFILIGCAASAPVYVASTSQSGFDKAVPQGETVTTGTATAGAEAYRIYIQGASSSTSLKSVRNDAEREAQEFCIRKGKIMESLSETIAVPPFNSINYPRIEIVFDCIIVYDFPARSSTPKVKEVAAKDDDPKYTKLVNLKKLLDTGVLTQQEFDSEKAKILSQP